MQDIYKHLRSYGLVKGHQVRSRLRKSSEAKLSSLLESYLDVARHRPIAVRAPLGATDIYPDSRATPLSLAVIRQLAIYSGRIYIHDPLLDMAHKWKHLDITMPLVTMHPSHSERVEHFREELSSVLEGLFVLEPLIEAGIVYLAPTELYQPKREPGAMYIDDLYGPGDLSDTELGPRKTLQDLPPQLIGYCQRALVVLPATLIDGRPVILASQALVPRNMIAVGFSGDPDIQKYYQLFDILPAKDESDQNDAQMPVQMYFDMQGKTSVNLNTFENWVEGSKYKSITEVVSRLEHDLIVAHLARAKFITNLQSSKDLALLDYDAKTADAEDKVITALLQLELPYFESADFSSIVKARQNEAAFAEFRDAMDKAFREIEALPQSQEFQRRVDEVFRDLLVTPLANIDRQMSILKRNLFLDAAILLGSLAATFVTHGNSLVTATAIYAATEAVKMYKQEKAEEDKLKQLPSFYYWEAAQKGK